MGDVFTLSRGTRSTYDLPNSDWLRTCRTSSLLQCLKKTSGHLQLASAALTWNVKNSGHSALLQIYLKGNKGCLVLPPAERLFVLVQTAEPWFNMEGGVVSLFIHMTFVHSQILLKIIDSDDPCGIILPFR